MMTPTEARFESELSRSFSRVINRWIKAASPHLPSGWLELR
jgi:hypothetical protein